MTTKLTVTPIEPTTEKTKRFAEFANGDFLVGRVYGILGIKIGDRIRFLQYAGGDVRHESMLSVPVQPDTRYLVPAAVDIKVTR